jgi:tRNA dimethylallyltransferase
VNLEKSPHFYIVGQTASGKTSLSLKLAEDLKAEILNTDSLLFYKNLNIGTAKPTPSELSRVAHHMVNICDIGEDMNASDYAIKAEKILKQENKFFFCVGGSGFYIDALDKGLLPLPETDPAVVKKVSAINNPVQMLEEVDSKTLESIAKEDLYRVKRALQVYIQTGKPLSLWKKENRLKPFAKKIALNIEKDELLKRVKLRVDEMFVNQGLLEEVEEILKDHRSKNWRPLGSVGYKQCLDYLNGDYKSLDELKEDIVTKTMQLAKRQKTWFKKDKNLKWFEYNCDYKEIRDYVLKLWESDQWRV